MRFTNTCRTCMHTGGIMIPMFQVNLTQSLSENERAENNRTEAQLSVPDLLKMFTKILLYENDGYPQEMCISCLEEIKRVFEFKMKCERSEKRLMAILQHQKPLLVPISGVSNNSDMLRTILINPISTDKRVPPPLAINSEHLTKILSSGSKVSDKICIGKTTGVKNAPQKSDLGTFRSRLAVKNSINTAGNTPNTENLNASQKTPVKIAPKFCSFSPIGNLIPIMPFRAGLNFGSPAILQPIPFNSSALIPPSNFQIIPLSNLIQVDNIPNTISMEIQKQFAPPEEVNNDSLKAQVSAAPAIKEIVMDNVKNDHDYLANTAVQDSNETTKTTTDTADGSGNVEEFECPACPAKLESVRILRKHFVTEHTKETVCLICNRKNIIDMGQHAMQVHMKRKHFCVVCNKGFVGHDSYARHQKRYSDKSNYECNLCEKKFCIEGDYRRHCLRHSRSKTFVCQFCNEKFCSNKKLNIHRAKQHSVYGFLCDICRRPFITKVKLSEHNKRFHSGSGPVKCDICQKTYPRLHNLKEHQRRCHSGRTITLRCPMCPSKYNHSTNLQVHIKTIHSEKGDINDRRCDICFKIVSHKMHLNAHRRTHLNIRPFKCEICHRTFKAKSSLQTHLIFHSAERPCKCPYCRLSFKTRGNLNQHKKAIHKMKYEREIEERESAKRAQQESDLVEEEVVYTT